MLDKGYELSDIRWINSGDLSNSMGTIINNTVLHTWKLLTIDFKYYHHEKLIMWGDGGIN